MPGWSYVAGNPINLIDPTGFTGEPDFPNYQAWKKAGGFPIAYQTWAFAIGQVYDNCRQIVAAAQRHGVVPYPVCNADPSQRDVLYALAGIIYQESVGFYREENLLDENDQPRWEQVSLTDPGTWIALLTEDAQVQAYHPLTTQQMKHYLTQ